jgi:anti-sigma regulatory factor (Ser/Thr protein kinase)
MSVSVRRAEMPRTSRAPAEARRMVDGLPLGPETAEAVRLAVSELVSNAVMHGTGVIAVSVAIEGDEVHVTVRDNGAGFNPGGRPVMPPARSPGGRGLALVAMFSSRWGVQPGDPTEVWCVVPVRG